MRARRQSAGRSTPVRGLARQLEKRALTVEGLRRSNNPPRFHRRNDNCVSYLDVGLCSSCLAVPMCVSNAHLRTTLVHGVDQRVIKIRDGTATQHAGVRKETVAGGEFLMQDREPADLRF